MLVNRDGDRVQAPVGELVPGSARARVLDRDATGALTAQYLAEQRERLGDAGHDDDVVRAGPQAAGPGQPARQLLAQPAAATRVAVARSAAVTPVEHRPFGPQPGGTGEPGQVRHPGREVKAGPGPPGLGRPRPGHGRAGGGPLRARPRQHPGARAPVRADQALLMQPLVRLDDHATGDPQVTGEHPGRGQERGARQPPVHDGGPEGVGQPRSQPAGWRIGPGELEEVGAGWAWTGPGRGHWSIIRSVEWPC